MFGIAAIVVMLCSFDMEYDELLANLRRAGMWLPAVVGLWIIIYLFNTLSWYIIIRDGKKGTPIPFWKVYKLTVSGFALNYATPVGLMGGEPYRIMELTPYVGASKATSSVILYVMMHIFSHFCFWFFSIFLYLALRPVDIAMGTILAVVGAVSLLAIYFFMKGYKNGMAVRTLKLLQHIPFVKEWAKRFSENKREALERVDSQIAELHKQRRSTFYANNHYKDSLRTRELGIRKKYTEELKNRNEIKRFIDSQLACWPLAHHNHEALQTVQTKELSINGYTFVVQCNAQRAVSTTAKVDKDSIQARPCFLCKENQPKEQKALETITANRICVNPYPILPDHLTIAHKDHIPQLMDENIFSYDDVRAFVQKYPDYALFYNGAHCGASAPDHLHLQGVRKTDVPIIPNVQQLITHAQTIDIRSMYFPYLEEEEDYPLECSRIYLNTKDYPCPLVILSSNTHYDDSLLYSALAAFPPDEDGQEAKFNLLLWKEGHLYYTVIFPRSKHRPDCYFAKGSEQMLISPGALDMAGVIVTTRQEDFDKITEEKVASIIKEVGITIEEAEKIPGRYFDEKAKR